MANQLTEQMIHTIRDAVATGARLASAAKAAGIRARTFRDWRKRGREDLDADRDTLHAQLVREVEQAEGEAQLRAVKAAFPLDSHMEPRDALAFMSRRWGSDWSEKIHHHVTTQVDVIFAAIEREFAGEPQILARLFEAITEGRSSGRLEADAADGGTVGSRALGAPAVVVPVPAVEAG